MNPDAKIYFDDDSRPVAAVDFDFAEVEAKHRDDVADIEYYRSKLAEFVRFACDALLSGNPSAEVAGRRAYFFALALKQPPFETQTELAAHFGISKNAVGRQLHSFLERNPLLTRDFNSQAGS